jgi:hypothetical protein
MGEGQADGQTGRRADRTGPGGADSYVGKDTI